MTRTKGEAKTRKPMPAAAEHAPLSVLNRSGHGIRTMTICSCGWKPCKAPESSRTMDNAHMAHRRHKGLPPADYAGTVYGEGPFMGLTRDEFRAQHGGRNVDPYTGQAR
jgi:hypothetical protein